MRSPITRRAMISAVATVTAGVAGIAVLAACGETQVVEKVVTVEREVEKIVTQEVAVEKIVTVEVAAPAATHVQVEFMTDHVSGPRGKAMQWGLARFAELHPEIIVRLVPAGTVEENLQIHVAAGTAPEVALLSPILTQELMAQGASTEITDVLTQMGVNKSDYYWVPDYYTENQSDHSFPAPTEMTGPQHGMPFQFGINGWVWNITMFEEKGMTAPSETWTWDDAVELGKQGTDVEADEFGVWARFDEEFQMLGLMYSNGLKKPVNDSLTKPMWDLPEAAEAFQWNVDLLHTHKVSPAPETAKELGGEFGDVFNAGRIALWPTGRVFTTGFAITAIGDRFRWGLAQPPLAPRTNDWGHHWNDQPHLVMNSAGRLGTTEQATALVVFMAGEEFQDRVGIDRGFMPQKLSIGKPASVAAPPEGMEWLKRYADRPDNRHRYAWIGFPSYRSAIRSQLEKAFTGDATAEEAIRLAVDAGTLAMRDAAPVKPFLREPVYPD